LAKKYNHLRLWFKYNIWCENEFERAKLYVFFKDFMKWCVSLRLEIEYISKLVSSTLSGNLKERAWCFMSVHLYCETDSEIKDKYVRILHNINENHFHWSLVCKYFRTRYYCGNVIVVKCLQINPQGLN